METQYLKTLATVLESGSFSRAASDLCITQSAVSQRVKFLEDRYGHVLIDRSGSVLRPTEAGSLVLKKTKQILLLEKELELELSSLGSSARLSLCCTPTFGIVYLPRVLNRFFLVHSDDVNLKFSLNTPEQSLKGVLQHDYDMAVIEHCGQLTVPSAATFPFPPDELTFISAPSLGLPEPEVALDELLGHRLIARREGCSSRCLLQENLAAFGKSVADFKSMMIHDDLHLTIQTVLAGRGVAFVSRSLVADHVGRGELRMHTVNGFNRFRSRTAVVHPSRQDDPVVGDFLSSVSAAFE